MTNKNVIETLACFKINEPTINGHIYSKEIILRELERLKGILLLYPETEFEWDNDEIVKIEEVNTVNVLGVMKDYIFIDNKILLYFEKIKTLQSKKYWKLLKLLYGNNLILISFFGIGDFEEDGKTIKNDFKILKCFPIVKQIKEINLWRIKMEVIDFKDYCIEIGDVRKLTEAGKIRNRIDNIILNGSSNCSLPIIMAEGFYKSKEHNDKLKEAYEIQKYITVIMQINKDIKNSAIAGLNKCEIYVKDKMKYFIINLYEMFGYKIKAMDNPDHLAMVGLKFSWEN